MNQPTIDFPKTVDYFLSRFVNLSKGQWAYPLCESILDESGRRELRRMFTERLGSTVIAVHQGWQGWIKCGDTPRERVLCALRGLKDGVDPRDRRRRV